MTLDTRAVQKALVTHAKELGVFQDSQAHAPMSPPTASVTCYWWLLELRTIPGRSGLNTVSALVVFNAQLLTNMKQQPYDGIDEKLMHAGDKLINSLAGGFQLGGQVEQVDLLGAYSTGVTGAFAWTQIGDAYYRAMNVTVPLVLDDLWTEVP